MIADSLLSLAVQIESVKPDPRNARLHPLPNLEAIKRSLTAYGQRKPIVVNSKTGFIEAGNGLWQAAKELGWTEIAAVKVEDDEITAKGFGLMDNKSALMADWDLPVLKDILQELDTGDFDMNLTGFAEKEIEELMTQFYVGKTDEDAIPVKVETICKTGDLWQLGKHRLLCGDSTKKEDVERLMQGEKADMVFTDPPYSVGIGKKNRSLNSVQPSRRCIEDLSGDTLSVKETSEMVWKPAFASAFDASVKDATIYVTMPQGGDQMMMMMMMSEHWQVKHELIWVKNQPTFSIGRLDYDYQHEPIVYGWKQGANHKWYGKGAFIKSVWNIDRPRENKLHPTMKPVALMENAIANSSRVREMILDPFGGSGSTLIACEKLNRKCRMIEIDEHYCDVIIARWEAYTGKKAVKIDE